MILVTGASGQLGNATVQNLLNKVPANQIAVLVRNENKVADLKERGINIRIGDYHNKQSLISAFNGVEKLLFVSTSDQNNRLKQQQNVVEAAQEAGVKHIYYTGALIKDLDSSPLKDFMVPHYQTEEIIKNSNLKYTFFRNNLYADILPFYLGQEVLHRGIFFPAGHSRTAFTLRNDMAEAFSNVIASSEKHENKIYDISSSDSVTFDEIAQLLSELSGKTISYTDADAEVHTNILKAAGLPEYIINIITSFAAGIKNNDFDNPGDTLERLLGRKPTSLKTYLKSALS